ncbi:MAG TPA: iron-sulfur cluster assembly accessory protein [Bdellovibrionota bacterium]|nr:iron-sulfur cluster assembly accessory protein [Bdellovibrionota bacterium]
MINLSDSAVNEIKRIQSTDSAPSGSVLRIRVVGGGCSGMSYKLDFDQAPPTESDKIFEKDGVKVVVDAKSYLFLQGTELDYSGGLNGKGFTFNNPNAKRTCGCGTSFSA